MKKTVRLLAVVMTVCMLFNTSVFAAPASKIPGGEIIEVADTALKPA